MLTIEIGVLLKIVLSFITKYFLRQLPQLTSCRKFFCSRHLTKRTCFGPQTRSRLFALIGRAIVISSVAVFAPSSSACFLYTIVRVSSWNEKYFFLKVVIIKGVVDGVAQLHSFNRQFCIRFYLRNISNGINHVLLHVRLKKSKLRHHQKLNDCSLFKTSWVSFKLYLNSFVFDW